ncbi:hypothetical protein TSAR_014176 [Trichomalopsis sarcophagae]|uniref:DDE Tnp4 domain-containing protein n=1 Tax=Trichomalopsis sarcophagae TaxID=543379 RepID=A0A232EX60_9HYME|nr:hypothetical protein TSAR_014176 [Trichomalopsis sarcophagae]
MYLGSRNEPLGLGSEVASNCSEIRKLLPYVALMLIRDLEADLVRVRASVIPPHIQVLSVLRFLAEGSYQTGFSQEFHNPISQATASRCIIRVVDAINNILWHRFLRFPTTEVERDRIQARFRRSIRIPGIIGLIDCFIIGMARPTANEEAFYYYRHGHGLIVQIVSLLNKHANYIILLTIFLDMLLEQFDGLRALVSRGSVPRGIFSALAKGGATVGTEELNTLRQKLLLDENSILRDEIKQTQQLLGKLHRARQDHDTGSMPVSDSGPMVASGPTEEVQTNQHRQRFLQLALERRMLRDACNLTPHVALMLIRDLEADLVGVRASVIPPHNQVLSVLRFLAEGSYQKGFSQEFHHSISQATASTCIIRVVDAINNNLSHRFLRFPTTGFRRSIRIPGIIGLIECFIIGMIVDANYNILNIRSCPGSNNDRYVWQIFSEAREYMENLRAEGEGDSAYTASSVLLTPILDVQPETPEAAYTTEHVRTRCRVEVLQRARRLHYTPNKLGRITNTCAILHNYRRRNGIHDNIPPARQRNVGLIQWHRDHPAGVAKRQRLLQNYYR